MLQGPYACKGKTADIGFIVGMKRQEKDQKYEGLMTILGMLGVHYTRFRLRVYAMLHDLTAGIQIPRGGKVCKEATKLGLPFATVTHEECRESEARRQFFYLRIIQLSGEICNGNISLQSGHPRSTAL